ncbi:MAG TPA: FAD-binding oxidoreductase [Ktedonobacterales bacterium]|jgi:FAD/FMN-containing dehydrogenase
MPDQQQTHHANDAAQVQNLAARMRGQLIQIGEYGYDDARALYSANIDGHPLLIARCADVADVRAALDFARSRQLPLAVRGGGHSGAGFATCDDGLVIDLTAMRGVRVTPDSKTVRVGGGCTWGAVDHATHGYKMATPSGFISTTGVGGLTLGGGVGYLTRAYGLALDNLLEADVVLADGRVVTASESKHPDLFWALRGGGGNFGVVTSFLFRLRPVDTVYGGPMFWPLEQGAEVMRLYRDFITDAPENINGWLGLMTIPPGPPFPEEFHLKKMVAIVWCYTGALDQAEAALAPMKRVTAPVIDMAAPLPFPALQSMFDALLPPGLQWYWKSDFVDQLSDEAIDLHLTYAAQMPTMLSTMHLYPISGAAQRVGKSETAFGFRGSNFVQVIAGVDPDPANLEPMTQWAREYWTALHPHSAGGGYVNMLMDEGDETVRAAYGANYPRLAKVKAQYDPDNLFHINQNIKPQP